MRTIACLALIAGIALGAAPDALAVTESEVLADSQALLADYEDLEDRFVADTEDHAVLEADYDALELDLAQLEADRASLPGSCGCTQIDANIAEIQDLSDDIQRIIDGWEAT